MEIKELNMERAACVNADPEIFFVDGNDRETVATAKSYCGICPIALECFTYAMTNEEFGIWGGTTMQERLRVRNNPRARKELIVSITTRK
jgi:WhiB family redox-sensing transcriptional regulator